MHFTRKPKRARPCSTPLVTQWRLGQLHPGPRINQQRQSNALTALRLKPLTDGGSQNHHGALAPGRKSFLPPNRVSLSPRPSTWEASCGSSCPPLGHLSHEKKRRKALLFEKSWSHYPGRPPRKAVDTWRTCPWLPEVPSEMRTDVVLSPDDRRAKVFLMWGILIDWRLIKSRTK